MLRRSTIRSEGQEHRIAGKTAPESAGNEDLDEELLRVGEGI
jgi:hypothetical protein